MKKTLVLLHGWGFQSQVWDILTPHLEDQFELIALDLPGFGNTPLPKETLTLESITHHVLENTPDKATYIGWSLGGLIAMSIAIHHPERVSDLMTIASTPKFLETHDWPGMSEKILNRFHKALKIDHQATLQQFALLQFHGSKTERSVIKSTRKLLSETKSPSERALSESLELLRTSDLRDELDKIQCRQLHLFGRCDTLVPERAAKAIANINSKSKIDILPKLSHAPFLSNPILCAEKIKEFLL